MHPIRAKIHAVDPYEGFDPDLYLCEVAGWNDHSAKFAELAGNAEIVVEVGSWLGASAIQIASACPNAHVLCIDTWLGAAEMWENQGDSERFGALKLKNGYPTVYFDFLANICRAELQDRVTPMPLPASIGLQLLWKWGIRPDLLYIDGSHDESDVCEDIQNALKVHPKVLCGDDFTTWTGVTNAVSRILPMARNDEAGFWWTFP